MLGNTLFSATLFLILAIALFHQSLRVLKNSVFSPKMDESSFVQRYLQQLASIMASIIWFIAGLIAFVTSIIDYASYIILNLQ